MRRVELMHTTGELAISVGVVLFVLAGFNMEQGDFVNGRTITAGIFFLGGVVLAVLSYFHIKRWGRPPHQCEFRNQDVNKY